MAAKDTQTLQRLWDLADRIAATQPGREDRGDSVFDPVGLILRRPPERDPYDETPLNVMTFAGTGEDGTHFNLLQVKGKIAEKSPVVITIPMAENHNIIVGENLLEFLRLGYRTGYGGLVSLCDQFEKCAAALQQGKRLAHENEEEGEEAEEGGAYKQKLLEELKREFDLKPWANVAGRLKELEEKYRDQLEFSEESGLE